MVEYCEFFKMVFTKILDFLRRLKIHSEALTRYWIGLRKSKPLLGAVFCCPILNLADSLTTLVMVHTEWTILMDNGGHIIRFFHGVNRN